MISEYVGRALPPSRPYLVGREKVREFALAVGEGAAVCTDLDAARAAGHPDLVAPPTFAVAFTLPLMEAFLRDPAVGWDYAHMVHGEQSFAAHRPLCAGDEVVTTLHVTRAGLVRYAGASGDFNPIHWNQRFAVGVGLPDVIGHGMLTMALAARLITNWVGDPAAVVGYAARFTRPVVVPDTDVGVTLKVTGTVKAVDDAGDIEGGGARIATVAITATVDEKTVLGRATACVRLPA